MLRAYADDMAVVFFNWRDTQGQGPYMRLLLGKVAELFHLLGRISALRLNVAKTILIPLADDRNQKWMVEHIETTGPRGSAAPWRASGEYLGFQLGPNITTEQAWEKPVKKHKRVRITCSKCGRSHSTASHRFHGPGSYNRTHK